MLCVGHCNWIVCVWYSLQPVSWVRKGCCQCLFWVFFSPLFFPIITLHIHLSLLILENEIGPGLIVTPCRDFTLFYIKAGAIKLYECQVLNGGFRARLMALSIRRIRGRAFCRLFSLVTHGGFNDIETSMSSC